VPGRGQRAEILGYGGHDGGTRDGLSGKSGQFVNTSQRNVTLNAIAIGGDSGGAIVTNSDGRLCGILSGTFPVVRPTASTGCGPGPIREWVRRWRESREPPTPESPPLVDIGPPEQPSQEIDYDKLADLIAGRMPKPKDGKDGRDGADGKNGSSAAAVQVEPKQSEPGLFSRLLSRAYSIGEVAAIIVGGGGVAGVLWWLFKKRVASRFAPQRSALEYRTYAESQADIYEKTGGRDKLWDVTIGRLFDQETEKLLGANDSGLAQMVGDLRDRVFGNARRQFTKGGERTAVPF